MPRASRQRSGTPLPVKIAIGALAVLLVGAPFVPRGSDDDGAVRPSAAGESANLDAATAGTSAVTAGAQSEIDRVVAQGRTSSLSARSTPARLAATQVRCATFEGQRYCLHAGWTTETPDQVVSGVVEQAAVEAARRTTNRVNTGDEDILTSLQRSAALSPTARAAADRAELTAAARSVAKVWLLRHQIQGVPLPDGFLEAHPEVNVPAPSQPSPAKAGATASPTATPTTAVAPTDKTNKDYPQGEWILDAAKVAEQTVTYYCGPTSMQMIAWNWSGARKSQNYWADRLGTTSNGSAISDMVRVTNAATGWDRPAYAGPYIVLDIKDFTYGQWMLLNMRHIVDYKAPLIFHPILLKEFYPYLDDDASGHFQVGRGYNKRGTKANLVSYFEPWNQQRFDPSEPYIPRVQNRSAYKSFRANQAHFQHNIGV